MNEKDLIKKAINNKMPNIEEVRLKCINQEVQTSKIKSGQTFWLRRFAPVAACAVIALATVFSIPKMSNNIISQNGVGDVNTEQVNNETTQNITNNVSSEKDNGTYIMPIELPSSSIAAMAMKGLVVYNGKVYTQAEYIYCDETDKQAFIGEYLGTAVGNIDEWSSKSLYDEEFASTVPGKVYSVNGYSKDFRICIPEMYEGSQFIAFFENLNDITLNTGEDLYGSRLSLKDNYKEVLYQLHEDWDWGKNNYKYFDNISSETLNTFVDALYSSPFVDASNDKEDIYDSGLKQNHLYFKMKDASTVEIRLFENGYVGYKNMYGRVYVQMTDDVFQTVFNASSN